MTRANELLANYDMRASELGKARETNFNSIRKEMTFDHRLG